MIYIIIIIFHHPFEIKSCTVYTCTTDTALGLQCNISSKCNNNMLCRDTFPSKSITYLYLHINFLIFSYSRDDNILVGYDAVAQAEHNPSNTLYDAKRFIGKTLTKKEVEDAQRQYSFKVGSGGNRRAMICIFLFPKSILNVSICVYFESLFIIGK